MTRRFVVSVVAVGALCAVTVACVGQRHIEEVQADATRPLVDITVDRLAAAYPLSEGTASKSAEIGRLDASSVNYLITKSSVRPHFHRDRDEVVYIVQGKATVTFGPAGALVHFTGASTPTARDAFATARRIQVAPGSVLLIPRGTAHEVDVIGSQPVVALSVFSPAFGDNDRIFLSE